MTTTKEGTLLAEHAADLLAGIPRPAKLRDPVDQVDGVSLTEMNRDQWQQDPNRRPRYAGELPPPSRPSGSTACAPSAP